MPITATVAESATPRFTIQPMIPLDKDFLRLIQRVAVQNQSSLPVWAENFQWRDKEEAVYFTEREWRGLKPQPAQHRVDLYTVMRGLTKVFDPKHDLTIAMRQTVVRSLYEQPHHLYGTNILQLQPHVPSQIIQLALFDQVVYG